MKFHPYRNLLAILSLCLLLVADRPFTRARVKAFEFKLEGVSGNDHEEKDIEDSYFPLPPRINDQTTPLHEAAEILQTLKEGETSHLYCLLLHADTYEANTPLVNHQVMIFKNLILSEIPQGNLLTSRTTYQAKDLQDLTSYLTLYAQHLIQPQDRDLAEKLITTAKEKLDHPLDQALYFDVLTDSQSNRSLRVTIDPSQSAIDDQEDEGFHLEIEQDFYDPEESLAQGLADLSAFYVDQLPAILGSDGYDDYGLYDYNNFGEFLEEDDHRDFMTLEEMNQLNDEMLSALSDDPSLLDQRVREKFVSQTSLSYQPQWFEHQTKAPVFLYTSDLKGHLDNHLDKYQEKLDWLLAFQPADLSQDRQAILNHLQEALTKKLEASFSSPLIHRKNYEINLEAYEEIYGLYAKPYLKLTITSFVDQAGQLIDLDQIDANLN